MLCVLVLQNASPEVVKVLAGNKCEVTNQQRAVDKERGLKVCVGQNQIIKVVCL